MKRRIAYRLVILILSLLLAGCEMPEPGTMDSDATGEVVETPTPEAAAPARLTVQVTGGVVNLRLGPSLDHAILGQAQQGDELPVTGSSADRQWLQVAWEGSARWLYAELTDVTPALRRGLGVRGPPAAVIDRAALRALYEATAGPGWTEGHGSHWLGAGPRGRWQGVSTNAAGRVVGLDLAGAGLQGPLPAVLGQLEALDLQDNRLYGPLPSALGHLPRLTELYLDENAWTGCRPAAWRGFRAQQSDLDQLSLFYCHDEERGWYDDPATHFEGAYQLQRRERQVTATLRTTRAPLPAPGQTGPVLFTLPSRFWPAVPYTRLVWGHFVQADGEPWTLGPKRPRARLLVAPDGSVRMAAEGAGQAVGYWAYTMTAAWEVVIQVPDQPAPVPAAPVTEIPSAPLHAAAAAGQKEVVRRLLSEGSELEAWDDQGLTPLQHAVRAGQGDVVQLLLSAGADVQARQSRKREGQTALHMAAATGTREMVALLLASGADLQARDNQGRSPLHVAVEQDRVAVAQLLLTAGANVGARDWELQTPLNYAGGRAMVEPPAVDGGRCPITGRPGPDPVAACGAVRPRGGNPAFVGGGGGGRRAHGRRTHALAPGRGVWQGGRCASPADSGGQCPSRHPRWSHPAAPGGGV